MRDKHKFGVIKDLVREFPGVKGYSLRKMARERHHTRIGTTTIYKYLGDLRK